MQRAPVSKIVGIIVQGEIQSKTEQFIEMIDRVSEQFPD